MPDDPEAYFNRGLAKLSLYNSLGNQYAEMAIDDFIKATELKPDEIKYWGMLTSTYGRIGLSEQQGETFKKALEALPDDPSIRCRYAMYLKRQGDNEGARQQVDQAIERAPDDSTGYRYLAAMQLEDDDSDMALETLAKAYEVDPTDAAAYELAARIYKLRREPRLAADSYKAAIEAVTKKLTTSGDEELPALQRRLLEVTRTQLQYYVANSLLDAIDRDLSLKDELLPEIKERTAKVKQGSPDSAQVAKLGGRTAYHEGNSTEAIALLEKADELFNRSDNQVADNLIRLYLQQSPGKAEEILDRYLEMPVYADNAGLLYLKAVIESRYRNIEKSLDYVNRALAADPEHEGAKTLKAELMMMAGNQDTIPADMALNEQAVRLVLDRASVLWGEDRRDEAIGLLVDLHERMPDNTLLTTRLVNMYLANDQEDECNKLLAEAQQRNPDNPFIKATIEMVAEEDPEERLKMRLALVEQVSANEYQVELGKALIYGQAGKEEELMAHLTRARELRPDSAVVINAFFRKAMAEEDYEEAEALAAEAAKYNIDDLDGYLYKAQILLAKQEYSEGVDLLRKASEEYPNSQKIKVSLGECLLYDGKPELAELPLRQVAEANPSYLPALIGMARVAEALGQTAEHKEWVIKAHRISPRHSYVRDKYLIIEEDSQPIEDVIAKREELLEGNPDSAENIVRLGVLYIRAGRIEDAERMYLKLWEHPRADKARTAVVLARIYRSLGQPEDAKAILEELLDKTDDKVAAYIAAGGFYESFDTEAAQQAYDKAVAAGPDDPRAYLAMSEFQVSQERWSDAADSLAKFLELTPNSPKQKIDMVTYLVFAERLDQADEIVAKMLTDEPGNGEYLTLKAMVEVNRSNDDKAMQLLNSALAQDPGLANALYYRSQINFSRGLLEEARRDLEQARRMSTNPSLSMKLADTMVRMNDTASARLIYEDVVRTNPSYATAVYELLNLYRVNGRWDNMERLLADAKGRFPGDQNISVLEAQMWMARGRPEDAVKAAPYYVPGVQMLLDSLIQSNQHDRVVAEVDARKDSPIYSEWIQAYTARDLAAQGKTAEADALILSLLQKASPPSMAVIVSELGKTYGAKEAAEKLLSWKDQIPQKEWIIYFQASGLTARAGDRSKTIELLKKALNEADTDPAKGIVHTSLAELYEQTGMFAEAAESYRSALDISPEDPVLLNALAYTLADKLDRAQEALPLAERAAAGAPRNGGVIDTYGWVLAKVGKLRDAEAQLARAARFMPDLPDIHYHLGWVYQQKTQLVDAQREYSRALELIGGNEAHPLFNTVSEALDQVRQDMTAEEQ